MVEAPSNMRVGDYYTEKEHGARTTSPIPVKLWSEINIGTAKERTWNLPPSSSLHHHPSFPFTESVRKVGFIVLVNEIVEPRLTTELVDSLGDFVPCSIA